jgi:hypothetical protein
MSTPTPIPCGPEGTFDHGLDYDVIEEPPPHEEDEPDLNDDIARHLPAVLAIGKRIEETVLADRAAQGVGDE